MIDLTQDWKDLEKSVVVTKDGWRLKFLPFSVADGPLAIAVDEDERHHLLIPIRSASSGRRDGTVLSCWAHKLFVENVEGQPVSELFLDIWCENTFLNRQFDYVVDSVIDVCRDKVEAEFVARAEVARWRRLFAQTSLDRELSFKDKLALFGELKTYQTLQQTLEEFDPLWWTGPNQATHDFELPTFHIEVKSVTGNSKSITVHSLEQLDESQDAPLYLVLQTIEPDANGCSLGEMLSELLDSCPHRQDLIDLAATAGIRFTDDSERFSLLESNIVQIDEEFPRIIASTLTNEVRVAINRLKYEILIGSFKDSMVKFESAPSNNGVI